MRSGHRRQSEVLFPRRSDAHGCQLLAADGQMVTSSKRSLRDAEATDGGDLRQMFHTLRKLLVSLIQMSEGRTVALRMSVEDNFLWSPVYAQFVPDRLLQFRYVVVNLVMVNYSYAGVDGIIQMLVVPVRFVHRSVMNLRAGISTKRTVCNNSSIKILILI